MPKQRKIRIIIDSNIWIGYLTGKYLHKLTGDILKSALIQIIISEELFKELIEITLREKFKSKFSDIDVKELIAVLESISEKIIPTSKVKVCRDPDDDFILALCKDGEADYLITGDKDLLSLKRFTNTKIVTAREFEVELVKLPL